MKETLIIVVFIIVFYIVFIMNDSSLVKFEIDGETVLVRDTPDKKEVSSTSHSHPATQCRLDTYFQGALCEVPHATEIGQQDEVSGACHGSLGMTSGLRPRCWFKPSVQ